LGSRCPTGTKQTDTLGMPEFTEALFKANPDKVFDVFLESPYRKAGVEQKRQLASDNYMRDFEEYYATCFEIQKQYCPYKNARFHYVDVRRFPSSISIYRSMGDWFEHIDKLVSLALVSKKDKDKLDNMIVDLEKHILPMIKDLLPLDVSRVENQ